ncbi:hypothetical protein [Catenulispora rubra]|uniref:hypothetical protein n=1 Tax=Catenulispora rubra TaxID=280293 RepID=UPI00189233FB|nr:hypothetical protein [Catenulispora rubra]
MDDTRKHLRQAAEAHQPDREAMLARIEQSMAAGPHADRGPRADRARLYRRRRQASWLKVALVGFAGVGVLGLGGLALAAGVRQEAPQHPTPVTVTPTAPATTSQPQAPATTKPPTSSGPSTPHRSATPSADGPNALNGLISAHADVNAHSTVYWSQNDLTLDVAQPLSALTVELRIAQTGAVQSTGDWQTAPPDDFTVTVTPSDGYLVYRWTLKPGHTIPAAQQLFGAQFNHATGKRDAGRDTYLIDATAAGHTGEIRGGFAAGN